MISVRYMNENTDALAYTFLRVVVNSECIYLTACNRSVVLWFNKYM